MERTTDLLIVVDPCPVCQERHEIPIDDDPELPVFHLAAPTADAETAPSLREILVTCPVENHQFVVTVPLPPIEKHSGLLVAPEAPKEGN